MLANKQKIVDLVVIGGGINGAAIARDAAMRNLSVILLEKDDFGCGASTKTSKLAHGGVRYLEQFQFSLVKESLKERALLLKNAPHLVKPLPFLLPVYSTDPYPLWQIHLGLFIYDYLAGKNDLPRHCKLTSENVLKQLPFLKSTGLKGGCSYFDAQMLDNRIVIENVLSAEKHGAIICNHTEVTGLIRENGEIKGVNYLSSLTGEEGVLFGKSFVNATGAWSATISHMEPLTTHCYPAPTKGVHLVVPSMINDTALLLRAPQDTRVFFILPFGQYNIIGTTDTFYEGDPDNVMCDQTDYEYLITAVNHFFPNQTLSPSSIVASFVGLRPLVAPEKNDHPSDIVREHAIQKSEGGLITVLGGKYTTHRLVAEEVVDLVVKNFEDKQLLACQTADTPLPGAEGATFEAVGLQLAKAGLEKEVIAHLIHTYGTASLLILELIKKNPDEAKVICNGHSHMFAELTYSIKNEHVKSLSDWFLRRTTICYTPCQGRKCAELVAEKMAALLGWSEKQKTEAIASYLDTMSHSIKTC